MRETGKRARPPQTLDEADDAVESYEPIHGDMRVREVLAYLFEKVPDYAVRLLGDPDQAADVSALAILRVLRGMVRGRYVALPNEQIRAIAFTAVRNLIHDERLKERRKAAYYALYTAEWADGFSRRADPADEYEAKEFSLMISEAVYVFTEVRRRIWFLVRRDKLDHEAVAKIVNLSTSSVNYHVMAGDRVLLAALAAWKEGRLLDRETLLAAARRAESAPARLGRRPKAIGEPQSPPQETEQ
jgi:DNA-directed RNA polymerase specialized sigma24 family protein